MVVVAVGSSSPIAGVAVFKNGELLISLNKEAPMAASGALMTQLDEGLRRVGIDPHDVDLFVADVGPGSFTGVKVGVIIAKTLSFAFGKGVAGVESFDLICADGPAAVPSRKNMYLVRAERGSAAEEVTEEDPRLRMASGYGARFKDPTFPLPERVGPLLPMLKVVRPEELVPNYVLEPSISVPKKPYTRHG